MNDRTPAEALSLVASVPANMLLLGEYAVLEEGGLGVTIAVDRRVVASLSSSPTLRIEGSWGTEQAHWPSDDEGSLLASIVAAATKHLRGACDSVPKLPLHIEVDSKALFAPSGEKIGLGSSAAVTVAVSFGIALAAAFGTDELIGLQSASSLPHSNEIIETCFEIALAAHRGFQGGSGSGYDVASSAFGGIGRFRGGAQPRLTSTRPAWLPAPILVRGRNPVRTPGAVARYKDWKRANASEASIFMRSSNECVEGFLSARDWNEAKGWFERAGELSRSLGNEIGVPAEIELPDPLQDFPAKAVGAGNELAVVFADHGELMDPAKGHLPADCSRLAVATDGVRIEHE